MMKNNSVIIKALVLVVTVIALGATATYAYFQVAVSGSETVSTINISGATLKLTYSNGSELKAENIIPGWTGTKNFQVDVINGTNKTVSFDVNLIVDSSNFYTSYSTTISGTAGTSYLTYALNKCTGLGTGCTTSEVPATTLGIQSGPQLVKKISPAPVGSNYYQLVLAFPNKPDVAQKQTGTDNNPLTFTGHVTVSSSDQISASSK